MIVYLLYGGLATNESDTSLGLPGPALFTAVTLNSYEAPSLRLPTVNLVSVVGVLLAMVHAVLPVEENKVVFPFLPVYL